MTDLGGGQEAVAVAPQDWAGALAAAKSAGHVRFGFLTAVDDGPAGLRVLAHVASADGAATLLLVTRLTAAVLDSVASVYAGADWHERETAEMFGIVFVGHPGLDPLLLPPDFNGHPLRKGFALPSRASAPWPGASGPGGSGRRRATPVGAPEGWEVPEPEVGG